jgi:predicted ArsR family transcriptional regulator
MAKLAFHPNAYLSEIKNIRQGLASRTQILRVLERKNTTAPALAKESGLNYSVILHHLRLLESEKIVTRETDKKPHVWELTGVGQQRLKTP